MNQSNPDLELPEMPLPPGLPPDEDTTPPLGLPATVDYHHLGTLLTALLPGIDLTLVSAVRIDYRAVRVEYWDGQATAAHTMPITHVQGSATEGGQRDDEATKCIVWRDDEATKCIVWCKANGIDLLPWQQDVIRAHYQGGITTRARRNGMRTIERAVKAYEAAPGPPPTTPTGLTNIDGSDTQ